MAVVAVAETLGLLLFIPPPTKGIRGKDCTRDAADVSNFDLEIRLELGVRTEEQSSFDALARAVSEGVVADGN